MATPIIFLDRLGLTSHFYRTAEGASLFDAGEVRVRLITSLKKLHSAIGEALESVVAIPSFDNGTLLEAASFQNRLGGSDAQRVVVLTEALLLPAAALREALDIPGDKVADILPFRDKIVMKEHLRSQGIRVPVFAPYSRDNAADLLRQFGAVIIKPRRESGGRDVNLAGGVADLDDFESRFADRLDKFEVEEFIDGRLYHIDSVVRDAHVIAATIGGSMDSPTAFVDGHYYRDIEVAASSVHDALLDFNARVIGSHPGFTGVTNMDVFVNANEIVFCEIAARWGGGGIRAAFRHRTGIDLVATMLKTQLGEQIDPRPHWSDEITGFTMIYPPAGRLNRELTFSQPWVVDQYARVKPGDSYRKPRAWEQAACAITVCGKDETEVEDRLDQVTHEALGRFE